MSDILNSLDLYNAPLSMLPERLLELGTPPVFTPLASYACIAVEVIERVAVIPVRGVLLAKLGATGCTLMENLGAVTGYDGIRASLAAALADEDVRAIVLDVDSGGGQIAGALDLADAIYAARRIKPTCAILSERACGTAYLLASAASCVTVPRTGSTGSIGVLVAHIDCSRALAQAGVTVTLIANGKHKADAHEALPLSDVARSRIQADVDAVGEMLVTAVARYRGLSRSTVRAMQGSTFLGGDGVDAGLADAVASPDQAFSALLHELHEDRKGERRVEAPQPAVAQTRVRTVSRAAPSQTPGSAWARLAFRQELAHALSD